MEILLKNPGTEEVSINHWHLTSKWILSGYEIRKVQFNLKKTLYFSQLNHTLVISFRRRQTENGGWRLLGCPLKNEKGIFYCLGGLLWGTEWHVNKEWRLFGKQCIIYLWYVIFSERSKWYLDMKSEMNSSFDSWHEWSWTVSKHFKLRIRFKVLRNFAQKSTIQILLVWCHTLLYTETRQDWKYFWKCNT